ncbi:MAG: nucleotidyltransferase family protein [Clostridia bacterium]|nr:nucleotidyltransferase family protein [Clostridia bacterium]
MKNKTVDTFLALLRGAVTGTHEPVDLTGVDRELLYELSRLQDMAHIGYDELERCGMPAQGELAEKLKKRFDMARFRHIQRDVAIRQTRAALEAAQIPFVFLKGVHLMERYPEPWMRTSSDVDVLVKERDHDTAADALRQAGFRLFDRTPHDVSFHTPEQVHVELHFTLSEDDRHAGRVRVFERVWDYAEPVGGGAEHVLRDEMFYFYHIAHMAKHVRNGGCGVRFFTDLWLLDHTAPFDAAARDALLREGGLSAFEKQAKALSEKWFSCAEPDTDVSELETYILHGGLYGSIAHNVVTRKGDQTNRFAYYLGRIFLPYRKMKLTYPILKKRPVLLPVYWVVRWFRLLDPKTRRRAGHEIRAERTMDRAESERIERLMKQLELW